MPARVRKVHGHEYVRTPGGVWVRNFTKGSKTAPDINNLTTPEERGMLLRNRVDNLAANRYLQRMEAWHRPKVVVVSDGHNFKRGLDALRSLPPDVTVIGVNRSLAKWDHGGRKMDLYLANNPYQECMLNLPRRAVAWPPCLASTRVYPEFLANYGGHVLAYEPACEENFGWEVDSGAFRLDDYRNPVCAAVHLAERWGVERLALLCCDDSFAEERPAAVPAKNGLWCYPAHRSAHEVVDAMLGWMVRSGKREVAVADASEGPDCVSAEYIAPESLQAFFSEEAV